MRKLYEAYLKAAVDGMLRQAKGWAPGSDEQLVKSSVGKFKIKADLAEMPDALLSRKLDDLS